MSDASEAVRKYLRGQGAQRDKARRDQEKLHRFAKRLGLSRAHGIHTLYRFMSLDGDLGNRVLDVIKRSRIYLSTADQFNDPFDCAPLFRLAGDIHDSSFVESLHADQERLFAEAKLTAAQIARERRKGVDVQYLAKAVGLQTRKAIIAGSKMLCLSGRQDHPLLWSHYAGGHRGICLHFRSTQASFFGLARRVHYKKRRPAILIPLAANKRLDAIADWMVLTKSSIWKYENEYRAILPPDSDFQIRGRFLYFEPESLCGITLGMNTIALNERRIRRWINTYRPDLRLYVASQSDDDFTVNIVRLR